MKSHIAALLVGAGLLGAARPAAAQTCTAPIPAGTCTVSTTASITIGSALQLVLSGVSTTLTTPTATDYDAGYKDDAGPTATVKSNVDWRLLISTTANTWTAAVYQGATPRANKPSTDLTWTATAGTSTTFAASTTQRVAASGTRTSGTVVTTVLRTNYSWTLDTPGIYTLTMVYTLTSP
jgi:hypothetical protein